MQYSDFLATKKVKSIASGFNTEYSLNLALFDFQRDAVKWALRRGRAALFFDCGLGKTLCQIEWANHVHQYTGKNILIFAPLAVSMQSQREGEKFDIPVNIARDQGMVKDGINITNYERLHKFDLKSFGRK